MTNIQILKKYNIKPSKKLGQNFLTDKSILKKIIEAADLKSDDIVLEIGPGLGILTIELARKGEKVIAIEKDKRMCEALKEILDARNVRNVRIVNKDILKMEEAKPPVGGLASHIKTYKLVANLPYCIVSPVIRKFLEIKNPPELMVLMVQKEVAQRICAKPPKMNLLAVAVQFYAQPKIISYVSKKSFYPQPKVDSAIIKMTPQPILKINTKKFFELVKTGFSSKRKMLKNNLKIKESILKDLRLNPKTRAENLSIKDWLNLFHKLDLV